MSDDWPRRGEQPLKASIVDGHYLPLRLGCLLAVIVAKQLKISLSFATCVDQLLGDINGPRIEAKACDNEYISRPFVKMPFHRVPNSVSRQRTYGSQRIRRF